MRFCESFPVTSQTFLPGEVRGGGGGGREGEGGTRPICAYGGAAEGLKS